MNEDIVINKKLVAKPNDCYVDEIKVELDKTYIHEKNIKEIKIYKGESAKNFSGAIGATVIKRKKRYDFVLLSKYIDDFKKRNQILNSKKTFEIIVNGTLIENTEMYQIELNPDIKITVQYYADDGVCHGRKNNKPKPQIIIETIK